MLNTQGKIFTLKCHYRKAAIIPQTFSVSFLCIYLFFIKSFLSSTICLLATLMNEIESEHYALPCKIRKNFLY